MSTYEKLADRLDEIMRKPGMTAKNYDEARKILPELRKLYIILKSDNNRRCYEQMKKERTA